MPIIENNRYRPIHSAIGACLPAWQVDSMPFNLGFQRKHILNPWSIHFNPLKVLLNGFALSFKILSAHCEKFHLISVIIGFFLNLFKIFLAVSTVPALIKAADTIRKLCFEASDYRI